MKKHKNWLLALLAVCTLFPFSTVFADGDSPDIIILPKPKPTLPPLKPRDVSGEVVRASYDVFHSWIEVEFLEPIGTVHLLLLDEWQREVAGLSCDTALEPLVYLSAPLTEGASYRLLIEGSTYSGEGIFTVQE